MHAANLPVRGLQSLTQLNVRLRPIRVHCKAVTTGPGSNGSAALVPVLTPQTSGQLVAPGPDTFIDARTWQPINLARVTLMELQGIPLQKTTDAGYNLTISYELSLDELVVIDYAKGLRFPAVFGPDNKVRVDINNPVPTAVIGLSFEALGNILRADSAAAELVNGRAAMLGVFLGLFGEVVNDDIVVRQLFTTEGAYNAMLVGALVLAASVAPAILGRVPVQNVFPDEENPPSMSGDLPNVWNYNAERLNGRVAMVGFLGLMVSELLSERQCGVVTKVLSDWGNWSC